jgi:hypothetical protein
MGIQSRFLLPAAAFLIVPALCAQSPHNQPAGAPFSVSITLARDVVKAGSEVRLDIVLTNTTNENIVIAGWEDQNCEIYDIEVQDSEGKRLPQRNECLPSENSNQTTVCVAASSPVVRTCTPQNQVLKPHGELKEEILVNELYDLSRPGQYIIQAQRANNPKTIVTVPGKFGYSRDIELDDKMNDASRATVESNTVILTVQPMFPSSQ